MAVLAKDYPAFKERLHDLLDRAILNTGSLGIALARLDGLLIAHRLGRADDARLAAVMAASILGAVASVALQLNQGDVNDVLVDCTRGKIVALRAGPEAAMIAWCSSQANVGLVLLGLRASANEIARVLEAM